MADEPYSNRRTFRRRRLAKDLDLIIQGEPIHAKLTDISVGGLGVIIKDIASLESPYVDIKISDADIDTKGRAVWVRRTPYGLKAGIHTSGPVKGKLSYFGLSDLLIGIERTGKTGVMEIDAGGPAKKIRFLNGELVLSSSDREYDRLGLFLLERGKISEEQYTRSLEFIEKSGGSPGAVLVELGYLTPADMIWAAAYHTEKMIMDMLNLDHGDFVFSEGPLAEEDILDYRLNVANLVYQGTKKTEDVEKIKGCCPPMDSILYLPVDSDKLLEKIKIDDDGESMLSLIDGKRMLKDIVSRSWSPEPDTFKTICALLRVQVVDAIAGVSDVVEAGAEGNKQEDTGLDSETANKIEKLFSEYKKLGYHGILGIGRNASLPEIKQAYHKMAKEYHPDRYLHFRSDSLKDKLNDIFVYINEAYRELSKSGQGLQQKQTPVEEKEPPSRDDNTKLAKQRFREGKEFLDRGLYAQALTLLGQTVYLDKSVAEYHFYYGIALLRNKKIKPAEESIKTAIQLDQYNAEYLAELGYIYLHLGFKIRAKHTFEKALKYDSSNKKAAEGIEEAGE